MRNAHRVVIVKLKRLDILGDLVVDGRVILKGMLIGCEGVDWIRLAVDRYQWRAPMNMVLNFRIP
jgi:hypothetical protein